MINWRKTKAELGTTQSLCGYRPKVWCNCDNCGKESIITIRSKNKIVNGQLKWLCQKCVGKLHSAKYKDSTLKLWKTQSYRNIQLNKKKELSISNTFSNAIKNKSRKHRIKLGWTWAKRFAASEKSKIILSDKLIKEKQKIGLAKSRKLKPRPSGGTGKSVLDDIIELILKDINMPYTRNWVSGRWTFDFLVNNKILLENNGDYWHSLPDRIARDKQKAKYASDKLDYKLEYIWEHEFLSPNRLRNRLISIGVTKNPINIDINDISVKIIDAHMSSTFLKAYHYLGFVNRAGLYIGAFYNNILIGVAAVGTPIRFQIAKKFPNFLELIRFCLHPYYKNKNLGSWFLARVEKLVKLELNPSGLISYADLIMGHTGSLYKSANWLFNGKVAPSYWYIDSNGNRFHKKTIWVYSKKMKLSEDAYASKFGLIKLNDTGKLRFIKYFYKSSP